ncbi:hypothetical protein CHLNCDRAFT_143182 [Chlorella variabilis]|uniref:FAD/NAD(P)-binding domain-containing protein n=1 Tax=Chlorella variabilis TaxID=554065 RepID=E1Z9N0_CHLVA|nr:hypothetical protein CHLNCDRAFT_143182 [Chlorella variabilis]EFN57549.1 hypothetical protein CHLNCDRAFT_143182 [Chlorella variabilis]|eukprot:XP_005849651.1 hypothetical protein CHLNCDRAFT_143182 [Chlorella variabilis]
MQGPKKKLVPGVDRPLTELDVMALRPKTKPHSMQWPMHRSWLAIAWDQAVESAEDIGRHISRAIRELPSTKASTPGPRAFDKLIGKDGKLRLQVDKPVVLVLGSGWGAHSLMKVIDTDTYEVVVVSPRNYFLFTPMLPSTSVGTVEFRSLLEPVRVSNPFVNFFEAVCDRIDLEEKVAHCTGKTPYKDGRLPQFEIPYDVLVVSVGEQPATFGTPGVEEHCFFMKEIPDSVRLRERIQSQFELATLPGSQEGEMATALHFVVVGGGPTGVEFAGTMSDFLREDLKKKYPELMPYVRVTLLNSQGTILSAFDEKMQKHALDNFKRVGVDVRTGVRVTEVTNDTITLKGGEEIKYGVCVWSAGNAPRPLVQQLAEQIPEQAQYQPGGRPSKLAVDPFLRVIGARDVLAIGDCSLVVAGQQGAYAAHMINRGFMPLPPPSKLADYLFPGQQLFATMGSTLAYDDEGGEEGEEGEGAPRLIYYKKPFEFLNLGIMAYLGDDRALTEIQLPFTKVKLSGSLAFLVCVPDQARLKAQVFGRDLSNF